jgi:hypothetical protein
MNSIIIPIHSFVDLITNSSSEIFVAANQSTIKSIKKLVNSIIAATSHNIVDDVGNEVELITADDLFTFDLCYVCFDEDDDEILLTKTEVKAKRRELNEIMDDQSNKYTVEQVRDAEAWRFHDEDSDSYIKSRVRVSVKDPTNKHAVLAANILSDLTGIFEINASYN